MAYSVKREFNPARKSEFNTPKLRFVQYLRKNDNLMRVGVLTEDGKTLIELSEDSCIEHDMIDFIIQKISMQEIRVKVENMKQLAITDNYKLLPPITNPANIICIGLNYKGHCEEQYKPMPCEEPIFFSKYSNTLVGPTDNVIAHKINEKIDWEVELAVIIGRMGRNIPKEKAMDYVYGYTIAQDILARDWQNKLNGEQFLIGKSMDTFCPHGPAIVHKSLLPDLNDLNLKTLINGVEKKQGNTKKLVFKIDDIIHRLSQCITLTPGDIILTGTPKDVSMHRNPLEYLKPGDVIETEIEGLGRLVNTVVAPDPELVFAIENNRLGMVKFFIARGADVNCKFSLGYTPLSYASKQGYLDIVNILIENGADLSTKTNKLFTPLHLAAKNGHLDIVNVFIEKGLDVNAVNIYRATPLHIAVQDGNIEVIKALISHGSDVNAGCSGMDRNKVDANITPLHLGTQTNRLDIVKALLEAGANVNAKTSDRVTPLHFASQNGFIEVVDILIKANSNVNAKDFENATPLHLAAARNHFRVVKSLLLVKGIDVNAKGYDNTTALHLGSRYGHLETVKLLIEKNANVNAKKNEGLTPLHLAIKQRRFEVCNFLIRNGANISTMDDQNWTPLHHATYNGFSLKIVESLIAKGAKINAKICDGRRALHLAAERNQLDIINILFKNGADVNALDKRHRTPLHCAAYDGHLEVAKSLLDKGADINTKTLNSTTPLHYAVDHNHLEVVELLLKKGADVNALDYTNWTPLHIAAEKGYNNITIALLEHGADVSVKENQYGCTALHFAAQYGHPKVVKTLIINGADVNAKMDENATPLHLGAQIGNLNIVKSLLMNGAYFNARAEGGRYVSPLHFAERRGSPEVIILLKLVEKLFQAAEDNNYLEIESYIRDGVIIDSKNVDGRTPLHYAVTNGHIRAVNILLANGADATKVTNKGNTTLHFAATKGHTEIIEALLQNVSPNKLSDFINAKTIVKGTTSLHVATENSFFEAVKSLLKNGAFYNIKNKEGKTPLDLSRDQNISNLLKFVEELFDDAKNGNLEIISKLKAVKPDEFTVITKTRNDQDKSLIQVAIINKHTHVAKRLLELLKRPDQGLQDISVENRIKSLTL